MMIATLGLTQKNSRIREEFRRDIAVSLATDDLLFLPGQYAVGMSDAAILAVCREFAPDYEVKGTYERGPDDWMVKFTPKPVHAPTRISIMDEMRRRIGAELGNGVPPPQQFEIGGGSAIYNLGSDVAVAYARRLAPGYVVDWRCDGPDDMLITFERTT